MSSGSQVSNFAFGLLSGEHFVPGDAPLALVSLFDGGVEDAQRGLPDVAAGSIPFDERNDRIVRNVVLAVGIADLLSVRGNRHAVISARHAQPPDMRN